MNKLVWVYDGNNVIGPAHCEVTETETKVYIKVKENTMSEGKYNRIVAMPLGDDVSLMYYIGTKAQKGAMVGGEDGAKLKELFEKYEKTAHTIEIKEVDG